MSCGIKNRPEVLYKQAKAALDSMGPLKLIFNTLFAWVPYNILMELYRQ